MLYIDVGNTLRGGLRTGIQRVVRSLSYELAVNAPSKTRLIAFDVAAGRYFALADPELIQSAGSLTDIGREARVYFDFADFARGDIFFEPDSSWTEPLNRGALFRRLKAQGVIVVVLNHDVIPDHPAGGLPSQYARLLLGDHRRPPAICRLCACHLGRRRPRPRQGVRALPFPLHDHARHQARRRFRPAGERR